jgi:hypothetical protein
VMSLVFADSESCSTAKASCSEKESIIRCQIRKLHQMRTAQMAFFDKKMLELRQEEASLKKAQDALRQDVLELKSKQSYIDESLRRLKVEREEIQSIKDLLRVETESVRIQSRDLKRLVTQCEKFIQPMTVSAGRVNPK